MAFTFGTTGKITSYGTGFVAALVANYNAPVSTVFTLTAPAIDSTRFSSATGGAITKRVTKGLREIKGSFKTYFVAPQIGSTGLITWGTYDAFLRAFDLTISAQISKCTVFNATPPEWESYCPGLVSWAGTADGYIDSATAAPGAGLDADPSAIALQFGANKSVSGNVITTSVGQDIDPSKLSTIKFAFEGDSNLATTGSSTSMLWPSDSSPPPYAITTPQTGQSMTIQTVTGQTYAGVAIWTSIAIKCSVDGLIETTVNWTGSGAWTGFTGV